MKAVVIGPGRIGCGFAGHLLRASGYDVVFVGRNAALVEHFNRVGRYRVRLASSVQVQEVEIAGIRALWTGEPEQVAAAIAEADVVAISVGPQNLPDVVPHIAAGLRGRSSPCNVLAFENLMNAAPCLRRLVGRRLGTSGTARHGFSGALVSRVVTQRLGDPAGHEPLVFLGDTPSEFVVHGPSLRPPLPAIEGMMAADDFAAWVMRKLYLFSAGHATTAYLGSLKGYHYIHTAIRDREIRGAVLAAMREGQRGLAARYGEELAGDERELERIVARFENAALNDPIQRVGRDPQRKLGAEERLVGAARLAEKAGVLPEKLTLATAAAFCFCNPADPSCDELQRTIQASGLDGALNQVCGLDPKHGLGRAVADSWRQLAPARQRGNLLLSLDRRMWAWS
jgi:mannitol-1-phosphate 5-dehydrogenase